MFRMTFEFRGYEISYDQVGGVSLTTPDVNFETGFKSVEEAIDRVLELEEAKKALNN